MSVRHYPAGAAPSATLVLAHGAGAGQLHPFMTRFARGLAERGIEVITFNFPYMEAGRRVPDRGPALEDAYAAVVQWLRETHPSAGGLFIGGKSMGGRIATQAAARGITGPIAGIVLLGYPLHPPGKPEQLRTRHLPAVNVPMFFVQGTRDSFGTPDELGPILREVGVPDGLARIRAVNGGDHSFAVPKTSGVPQDDVYREILDDIAAWISGIISNVGSAFRRTRSG